MLRSVQTKWEGESKGRYLYSCNTKDREKLRGKNQGEYEIMINEKQKTTCNARNKNRSGR